MGNGKRKILIFGGSGLVGSEVARTLSSFSTVICPTSQETDVTNKKQVGSYIKTVRPDYVIYAAGFVRVDEAEQNPDTALLLNFEAPKFIAEQAAETRIPLCYFSTDAVFDGTQSQKPYSENDKTNPVSVYGKSKLRGENAVLSASDKNIVLRINMAYSASYARRKDSARIILESLKRGSPIGGITDQYITPAFVPTIAMALNKIIDEEARGIYHLGSTDYCTNYEFAKKIAKIFGYDENLVFPIALKEFSKNKAAHRALCSWLDTNKFRNEFGNGILQTIDEDLGSFGDKLLSEKI